MGMADVPIGAQARVKFRELGEPNIWRYGELFLKAYFCRYCVDVEEYCEICQKVGMKNKVRNRMTSLIRNHKINGSKDDEE